MIVIYRFKAIFQRRFDAVFSKENEEYWWHHADGVTDFNTPTMEQKRLLHINVMHTGSHPKMLLYAFDKLFYVFRGLRVTDVDMQCIIAYEIHSFALLHCMEQHGGLPMDPCLTTREACTMMDLHDEVYLELLVWVVYDGALLPGDAPTLSSSWDWSHVMARMYKHIYQGVRDSDHCPPCTPMSFDYQQRGRAIHQCHISQQARHSYTQQFWCGGPSNRPMTSPHNHEAPALVVTVPQRVRSSFSIEGAAAVSLDHNDEDMGEEAFHRFHVCRVQLKAPQEKSDAPLCRVVQGPQADGGEVDPLWKTPKWLQCCKEQYTDNDFVWWLLLHPLTDGRDEAVLALAQCLMATWRWTATISESITCLPAPTILNIGQFLCEKPSSDGWNEQQWLEAYS